MKRTTAAVIAITAALAGGAAVWKGPALLRRPTPQEPGDVAPARYVIDGRPLVFTGGLTNKGPENQPPYGEHPGWAAGDPDVVYEHLDLGTDRVVLRQIVAPGRIGFVLFSTWHPLAEAQREAFRVAVRRWKGEKPGRTVGLFFRRDATDPFVRRDEGIPEGPYITLDPLDPTALRLWHLNTAEVLEYIDEVWLDGGSANDLPDTQAAIVRLARHLRRTTGTKLGIEAIPFRRGPDGEADPDLGPDWEYIAEVPALAVWRFVWHRWISRGQYHLLEVPARYRGRVEVHVLLARHPGHLPTPAWPEPTQADIDKLRGFGWTISYLDRIFEPDAGGPTPQTPGGPP